MEQTVASNVEQVDVVGSSIVFPFIGWCGIISGLLVTLKKSS